MCRLLQRVPIRGLCLRGASGLLSWAWSPVPLSAWVRMVASMPNCQNNDDDSTMITITVTGLLLEKESWQPCWGQTRQMSPLSLTLRELTFSAIESQVEGLIWKDFEWTPEACPWKAGPGLPQHGALFQHSWSNVKERSRKACRGNCSILK